MQRILSNCCSFITALIILSACSYGNPSRYGKIKQYNTSDKKSFVFSVDDQFTVENQKSKIDKEYPLMTKAEARLLRELMLYDGYCLNSLGQPRFIISSKQEKIYDVTFAHLIEQSYNAKPVSPRMYFGECQ